MARSYDKAPEVVVTNPRHHANDIATTLQNITIGFNTDLDVNNLIGNVSLKTKHGDRVKTKLTYNYRTITLSLEEELEAGTTYTVHVLGDSNTEDEKIDGIRNVFGTPLAGIYMFTFSTEEIETLVAPDIIYPLDETVIKEKPGFTWNPVVNGVKYELQISKSNTMTPIIWPIDPEPEFTLNTSGVIPNIPLRDGSYYWRVRAIDSEGNKGDWTKVCAFTIDTQEEGTVSEEDTLPPDQRMSYDPIQDLNDIEVIEAFPATDFSNVKTNLQTIYFHVLGEVSADDVDLTVLGESITGEEEDHGDVSGTVEILPQSDGTTIISFTPDPITASS